MKRKNHYPEMPTERPCGLPPIPPPCRTFKQTFWSGLVETKESRQATRDWKNYIRGYGEGLKVRREVGLRGGRDDRCYGK